MIISGLQKAQPYAKLFAAKSGEPHESAVRSAIFC